MTQEKFKQANKLCEEIYMLDWLIKQIEDGNTINPHMIDYEHLIHLFGVDKVLDCMQTKKRMLEKEFEEL